MDIQSLKLRTDAKISSLQQQLISAEDNNLRYKKLEKRVDKYRNLEKSLELWVRANKVLLVKAREEYKDFKERRLGEISEYITGSIAVVFPERGYRVNLIYDDNTSQKDVTLSLVDNAGRVRYPKVTEGGLNNQIIAYAAAFGLVKASGQNKMYIDEAFASAHRLNLDKTSKNIEDAINSGFQIFLIQQAEAGYENLERREFFLQHSMDSGLDGVEETTIKYVKDFEAKEVGDSG